MWVLIGLVALLPVAGFGACGVVLVGGGILIDRAGAGQLATLGGCPSSQTPHPPQGVLKDSSEISVGLPIAAVGCWEAYADDMLARDVYTYYISRESLADWRLEETYAQTMYIRLANKLDAKLLVDVSIETGGGSIGWGPTRTRIDISICRCDPDLLKG